LVRRTPPSFNASPLFWIVIHDRFRSFVVVAWMPLLLDFWITPPEPAEPVPVTVRPPLVPVLLSRIPLAGPLPAVPDEMLRNVSPLAPIVVPSTFKATPVVVAMVFVEPVTFTVPPPVAMKPLLVPSEMNTPPVRLSVVLALEVNSTPPPGDKAVLMAPDS